MFKGKIHRATVTEANLNYMGSVTIDKTLLDASGILPGEKVSIVNNNNTISYYTNTVKVYLTIRRQCPLGSRTMNSYWKYLPLPSCIGYNP